MVLSPVNSFNVDPVIGDVDRLLWLRASYDFRKRANRADVLTRLTFGDHRQLQPDTDSGSSDQPGCKFVRLTRITIYRSSCFACALLALGLACSAKGLISTPVDSPRLSIDLLVTADLQSSIREPIRPL